MAKILVAGSVNLETSHRVDGFPIEYRPVRRLSFDLATTVAGIAYNVTKALHTLGHQISLYSLVGKDFMADVIRTELGSEGISAKHLLSQLKSTPQASIFYDATGKRMVFTDRKDIQDAAYPLDLLDLESVELAVISNLNFCRPFLEKLKAANIPIASDVQVLRDLEDEYNREFLQAATILFMSDAGLNTSPELWLREIWAKYQTPIVGIGMGDKGVLLGVKEDNHIVHFPAKLVRPIVNTVGAGDALFSAFLHAYLLTKDPYLAMKQAILFAGYKIGSVAGADGFLTAQDLAELLKQDEV